MLKKMVFIITLAAFGSGIAEARTAPKAHDHTPRVKDRSPQPRGTVGHRTA